MPTQNGRHQTDDELVADCLRGSAAAWEVLIARYQGLIYSIGLRSGLSAADADDVFQNVCVKLCQHLGGLKEHAALTAWIGAVTRQECGRLWRRGGASAVLSTPLDAIGDVPSSDAALDDTLLRDERAHLVRRGMETLPAECRRLLGLLYGSDEPVAYVDVSARLGLPLGSIGPKRARCLERLRKKMDEQEL